MCIRLPSGRKVRRRFHVLQTFQNVRNFIDCHEMMIGDQMVVEYEILSSYPTRAWSDVKVSLRDTKLGKQILFVVKELVLE